jgi:hypothetical protein
VLVFKMTTQVPYFEKQELRIDGGGVIVTPNE